VKDKVKAILFPWQKRWVQDRARLKMVVKSTQIGYSFAQAYDCVLDCMEKPKNLWIILSRSERQALEFARKAKEHCKAIGAVARLVENDSFQGTEIKQHVIEFPNSSRIIAVTSNPDTARGYSGNIVLDEFAFHKDSRAVYQAAYGRATRGYRLVIMSTPFGESGRFYELAKQCDLVSQRPPQKKDEVWSGHYADIFMAQAEGLTKVDGSPIDVEELRAGCRDEDTWQQEYCGGFISDATSVIPWEQIVQATHVDAGAELLRPLAGPLGVGYDIARYRDLAVVAAVELVGDVYWMRGLRRMRRATFSEQKQTVGEWVARARRACVDATGMGLPVAEELVMRFGSSKVEAIQFNIASKEVLVTELQRVFQENRIRIPDDRDLHAAIHAVRKYATGTGHFRFDADRTEQGHADEFWALALAVHSLSTPGISVELLPAGLPTAASLIGRDFGYGAGGSAYAAWRGF